MGMEETTGKKRSSSHPNKPWDCRQTPLGGPRGGDSTGGGVRGALAFDWGNERKPMQRRKPAGKKGKRETFYASRKRKWARRKTSGMLG